MVSQKITTFVFSDIEQSTKLAQQYGEDYPELIESHRSIIRAAIKKYSGYEINTTGDGFFMAFEIPRSAVIAAKEMQSEFYKQKWVTEIGLKVRMGIHTGTALLTKSGYSGVEIHRASRISNAAHGGQVLISSETKRYLESDPENDLLLADLGDYLLKDFDDPIGLFQLIIPGKRNQFPMPRIDPTDKKIAVLPFICLNKDLETEHISEGMAEEIIMSLGKVNGLKVVSRSSAFALKKGDIDVRKVGQKLKVSSVLTGRIKSNNGYMRISVELIDTESGFNIWSGQFDSEKEQLLNMQEQITRKITEALDCSLKPKNLITIRKRQTHNAEAYDYYLRGRRFYIQFSGLGIKLAVQMFKNAIEADNTYALAYAGLADCYSYQFQHNTHSAVIIDKADEVSKKAVELAPKLADVYISRGIVMALRMQFIEAEKFFQKAIDLDPAIFLGWFHYARACFVVGELDKAARLFEQANHVDPDDYQSLILAAQVHNDIGNSDLSKNLRKRGVETAERRLELNPGDTRALYMAANALAFLDQREKCISFLQRALLLDPDDSMLLYNAGCVYSLLQMKAEALHCLVRSYEAGLSLHGWFENDSNLDNLRTEPRFIALLEKMKNIPL